MATMETFTEQANNLLRKGYSENQRLDTVFLNSPHNQKNFDTLIDFINQHIHMVHTSVRQRVPLDTSLKNALKTALESLAAIENENICRVDLCQTFEPESYRPLVEFLKENQLEFFECSL